MGGFFGPGTAITSSGFFGAAPPPPPAGIWILRTLPALAGNIVAVAGSGTRIVVLDDGGGIIYSDDHGATWATGSGFSGTNTGRTLVFSGSLWVAICDNGVSLTSADGATWTVSGTIAPIFGRPVIAFGNGLFVVGTNSSAQNVDVYTSPDGATWTGQGTATPTSFTALLFDGTNFVGAAHDVGGTAEIAFSSNGAVWTSTLAPSFGNQDIPSLAFHGGNYVATDRQFPSLVQSSPSAVWSGTNLVQPLDDNVWSVAFGDSVWCLAGQATASTFPQAATSTDLTNWTLEDLMFGPVDFENVFGLVSAAGILVCWSFSNQLSTRA